MSLPSVQELYAVTEATWPAVSLTRAGPWTIRDGQGGGKRVSSATAEATVSAVDIPAMEAAMAAPGQPPLVMVREGEAALDALLEAEGYAIVDPVVLYAAPVASLAGPLPPLAVFAHWPRLAVAEDLWAEGGIGPGRLQVMDRVTGAKTALLARTDDTPAGAAFAAMHHKTAMIHAIEVTPKSRRKGTARNILRAGANWAQDQGAEWLALVVTERNAAARALYASLGMQGVGHYHYRMK